MANTNTRQAKRAPVTLKIKFKSATLDQFIERYSVDISQGGIFIRTKDPLPVGTTLKFEFQLKDASPLIAGDGTVVWTREHDPSRGGIAPGMGVRFDRLPQDSQGVLKKILDAKNAILEEDEDDGGFVETPTRVAPSPLVNQLMGGAAEASPFDDLDDVPEEAFEESTKVGLMSDLVKQTAAGGVGGFNPLAGNDEVTRFDAVAPFRAREEESKSDAAAVAPEPEPVAPEPEPVAPEPEPVAPEPEPEPEPVAAKPEPVPEREPVPAPAMRRPAVAAAAARDDGGSIPWIAVAGVIIVAGAIGGFIFLNKDDQKTKPAGITKPSDAKQVTPPDSIQKPDDPVKPANPVIDSVDVTVTTKPAGVMAKLVGGDQGGPTPFTFKNLNKVRSYKVELSKPGLGTKIVTIHPDEETQPVHTLTPMKKMLSVTTDPVGATFYLNGRRFVTPVEIPIEGKLVKTKAARWSIKLRGYTTVKGTLNLTTGFETKDGNMVLSHTVTLAKSSGDIVRPKPPPKKPENGTKPPPKDPVKDPVKDGIPVDPFKTPKDPPKEDPPESPNEPTPDWMK